MGENSPPHHRRGAQMVNFSLGGESQSGTLSRQALHILVFLAPVPLFLDLFIWGLWQRSFSDASTKASFLGSRRKPRRHISPLWHNAFLLQGLTPPVLTHLLRSIKPPELLAWLPQKWDDLHLWDNTLDPRLWTTPWGKWNRPMIWFHTVVYAITVHDYLFHFWLVALIGYSSTWQLSLLSPKSDELLI